MICPTERASNYNPREESMPKSVIIVDDSTFLSKQISDFFVSQLGFQVLAIGKDGNDAVELYRKHKPDLVTMDLTMPNKDGKTAINEILAEFADARILVISAVKGNTVLECLNSGAKGYVEKPLKFSDPIFVEDFKQSVDEAFK
jgi:two-component system chemotaxis response regulator CheY